MNTAIKKIFRAVVLALLLPINQASAMQEARSSLTQGLRSVIHRYPYATGIAATLAATGCFGYILRRSLATSIVLPASTPTQRPNSATITTPKVATPNSQSVVSTPVTPPVAPSIATAPTTSSSLGSSEQVIGLSGLGQSLAPSNQAIPATVLVATAISDPAPAPLLPVGPSTTTSILPAKKTALQATAGRRMQKAVEASTRTTLPPTTTASPSTSKPRIATLHSLVARDNDERKDSEETTRLIQDTLAEARKLQEERIAMRKRLEKYIDNAVDNAVIESTAALPSSSSSSSSAPITAPVPLAPSRETPTTVPESQSSSMPPVTRVSPAPRVIEITLTPVKSFLIISSMGLIAGSIGLGAGYVCGGLVARVRQLSMLVKNATPNLAAIL